MELKQTFNEPIHGYWDGGPKQTVKWSIDSIQGHDSRGTYVRIGSWSANHWFNVALGKTDKLTLRNAMSHLRGTKVGKQSKFEYVENH
jgi:hypothetical protein